MSKIVFENGKSRLYKAVTKIECLANEERLDNECPIRIAVKTGDSTEERGVTLRELIAVYAREMTGGASRNRCEFIWDKIVPGETRVNFERGCWECVLTGTVVRKYDKDGNHMLTVRTDAGAEYDIYATLAWPA